MGDAPPTKRRPRFSLLNALCLITAATFGFGLLRARERNVDLMAENARVVADAEAVEAENTVLRAELGIITITDPTKFHAMQLESENDLEWKWRIYLPEGSKYRLRAKYKSADRNGPSSSGSGTDGLTETGQQTITFRLFKQPHEDFWRRELKTRSTGIGGSISPDLGAWAGRSVRLATKFGTDEIQSVELGEPIKLFDLRVEGRQSDADPEPWPREPFVQVQVSLEPLE